MKYTNETFEMMYQSHGTDYSGAGIKKIDPRIGRAYITYAISREDSALFPEMSPEEAWEEVLGSHPYMGEEKTR